MFSRIWGYPNIRILYAFFPISKHSINGLQIISFIFIRWMRLWGGLYHELIKLLETRYFHLKDLFLDFVDFATALNCILLRLEIPYQPQSLKQIFRNGCFLRDPGKRLFDPSWLLIEMCLLGKAGDFLMNYKKFRLFSLSFPFPWCNTKRRMGLWAANWFL